MHQVYPIHLPALTVSTEHVNIFLKYIKMINSSEVCNIWLADVGCRNYNRQKACMICAAYCIIYSCHCSCFQHLTLPRKSVLTLLSNNRESYSRVSIFVSFSSTVNIFDTSFTVFILSWFLLNLRSTMAGGGMCEHTVCTQ